MDNGETLALPKFRRPPVDEVVVGIQFAAPGFKPIHFGLFYQKIKAGYPVTDERPAIPPALDYGDLGGPQPQPFSLNIFGMPRLIFVSDDGESLVQLQNDRLYFNWRRVAPEAEYKHFDYVRNGFASSFTALKEFAAENEIGPIEVSLCEVDYVNLITSSNSDTVPSRPEDAFAVWSGRLSGDWDGALEDLAFNARYHLSDHEGNRRGRLTSTLSTVPNNQNEMILRLELVARGRPTSSSLDDVLAFHDLGHAAIVRCFYAMTTEKMHDKWDFIK